MDAEDGAALLLHAIEAEEEEKLYSRWIAGPQFSLSFEDFKRALNPPPEKSSTEILEDIGDIMSSWEATRDGNI